MTKRVLITGAGGQLGHELQHSVPGGYEIIPLTRSDLNICDAASVQDAIDSYQPAALINAAAYTAVDQAETDQEQAHQANAVAPGLLASACAAAQVRLIHISTDFVFDGSACQPIPPDATPGPLGAYGRSKLAGELAVQAADPAAVIVRTGWVYSAHGANFVKTMLRLMGEREELAVVADQVGTPTWAAGLAEALWHWVARPALTGTYHWSDAGVCSWYDFAVAIEEEGRAMALLEAPTAIRPIAAKDYPTPATRPAYSVLDKQASWQDLALTPQHWRVQLRRMLRVFKDSNNG